MKWNLKMSNELEMWKIRRVVGWLDCIFDTCFLAFLWIMGWKIIFWVYVFIAISSVFGHAYKISKLEKKLL